MSKDYLKTRIAALEAKIVQSDGAQRAALVQEHERLVRSLAVERVKTGKRARVDAEEEALEAMFDNLPV